MENQFYRDDDYVDEKLLIKLKLYNFSINCTLLLTEAWVYILKLILPSDQGGKKSKMSPQSQNFPKEPLKIAKFPQHFPRNSSSFLEFRGKNPYPPPPTPLRIC